MIRSQMFDKTSRQSREIPAIGSSTDGQSTGRPGIGQRDDGNAGRSSASTRSGFGNDTYTDALRSQVTDAIEGAQPCSDVEPDTEARRLAKDVILQRSNRQPNYRAFRDVGEENPLLARQLALLRGHNDKAINSKREQGKIGFVYGV